MTRTRWYSGRRVLPALAAAFCCLPLPTQTLAQIPEEVEVTRVASGLRYPAGLAWSRDGFLIIADDEKREIYRLDVDQRPKPTHQDSRGVQGIAYDTQSRLYMCETETRRLVRLDKRGIWKRWRRHSKARS